MLRLLLCGLLLGTFLLAPSGCGQFATAPDGAPALSATATAAVPSPPTPRTGAILPSASMPSRPPIAQPAIAAPEQPHVAEPSATAGAQLLTMPTASGPPIDRPNRIPVATALPTSSSIAPQTQSGGGREVLRGRIASLDENSLTLDVSSERIYVTTTTNVVALTKPLPTASLAVGRDVVVQAARDAQGRLVAQQISILPVVLRKPLPPAK